MSDREFDNYLALLAGLLRLDRRQRGAIADELRAHLEDRLEELLAEGLSRDEAVRRALAEFGDAAGLAGQFVALSQQRTRRWLMRLTTFSVAATLLLATGITIFWPGRNAAPGLAQASAQQGGQKTKATEPTAPPALPQSQTEAQKLQAKLAQRLDASYAKVPLNDVLTNLHDQIGVQFYLNQKMLEEAGVAPDVPITIELSQVRLSTLLDLILRQADLTYVENDNVILITTPEDAESNMQTRVYDCRDLLSMEAPPGADQFIPDPDLREMYGGMGGAVGARLGGAGERFILGGGMFAVEDEEQTAGKPATAPGATRATTAKGGQRAANAPPAGPVISVHDLRSRRLMELITASVDPHTWSDVGGAGSIEEYNGLVVVTQTAKTHDKIEHVLDMLRRAAGLELPEGQKVVR